MKADEDEICDTGTIHMMAAIAFTEEESGRRTLRPFLFGLMSPYFVLIQCAAFCVILIEGEENNNSLQINSSDDKDFTDL